MSLKITTTQYSRTGTTTTLIKRRSPPGSIGKDRSGGTMIMQTTIKGSQENEQSKTYIDIFA